MYLRSESVPWNWNRYRTPVCADRTSLMTNIEATLAKIASTSVPRRGPSLEHGVAGFESVPHEDSQRHRTPRSSVTGAFTFPSSRGPKGSSSKARSAVRSTDAWCSTHRPAPGASTAGQHGVIACLSARRAFVSGRAALFFPFEENRGGCGAPRARRGSAVQLYLAASPGGAPRFHNASRPAHAIPRHRPPLSNPTHAAPLLLSGSQAERTSLRSSSFFLGRKKKEDVPDTWIEIQTFLDGAIRFTQRSAAEIRAEARSLTNGW